MQARPGLIRGLARHGQELEAAGFNKGSRLQTQGQGKCRSQSLNRGERGVGGLSGTRVCGTLQQRQALHGGGVQDKECSGDKIQEWVREEEEAL